MNPDVKARLGGLVCIVIGLAISWPAIFDRIRLAQQGVPEINTWSVMSALVGPFIVIGLTLIILGSRTEALTRDAENKRLTLLGNLIALACAITGFGAMLGTMFVLRSYGYQ